MIWKWNSYRNAEPLLSSSFEEACLNPGYQSQKRKKRKKTHFRKLLDKISALKPPAALKWALKPHSHPVTTQTGNILHPTQCSHHPPPALLTEGSSQDVSRKSTWPELHHERQSFSCLGIHMFSPLLCLRSRLTGTAAELNNQAGKLTSCKDLVTLIFI